MQKPASPSFSKQSNKIEITTHMDEALVSLLQVLFPNNNGVMMMVHLVDLAQQQAPAPASANTTPSDSPYTLCVRTLDELAEQLHCTRDTLQRYLAIFTALGIVKKDQCL